MSAAPTATATPGSAASWSAAATPPFSALLDLVDLADAAPGTDITWAVRRPGHRVGYSVGGGINDALPARGAPGERVRRIVKGGKLRLVTSFNVARLTEPGDGVLVAGAGDVQLVLPETGVCSSNILADRGVACCAAGAEAGTIELGGETECGEAAATVASESGNGATARGGAAVPPLVHLTAAAAGGCYA